MSSEGAGVGTAAPGPIALRVAAPATLEIPSPHLGLDWRPLKVADARTLHGLVAAIEEADSLFRRTSLDDVEAWLELPWQHLAADSLAGFDHLGELRAYGLVSIRPGESSRVRALLDGGVHPEWRGVGVGRALVTWLEGRGRQMLAATGRSGPARLAVYVDASVRDRRAMYAAAGFSPIRWYTDMRRDLADPLPDAQVPAGVRLVAWREDLDDAVREAHNAAFADHWGSEPHTPETWQTWRGARTETGWSLVALDGSDQVVGYLLSERFGLDKQGFTSGHVLVLGVPRSHRRTGLGTALLVTAMRQYREAGMQFATLDVDTDNPTGAHGLYERLGFVPTHSTVLYSVEI